MRFAAIVFCALICHSGFAQSPVGIFDHHADIGNPKNAGTTLYDEGSQTYTIKGSGYNIWFNRDEFQYAYKKIGGDFMLTANFAFNAAPKGADGHRKIGWMIRESMDEGAACSNACMHIDGLTVLQWRPYRGMYMRDPEEEIFASKKGGQIMRLERVGKKITMSIAHPGEPLQVVGSYQSELKDSVLVGIYICAHDSNAVAEGQVWNVRIDKPVVNEFSSNPHAKAAPAPELPGYRLETMDVFGGIRKVVCESTGRITAPGGGMEASKFIYYNDNFTGTMQIWRMTANRADKEQLTFDQYHNWFPHVSPDGKWIVFISYSPDIDPSGHPADQRLMIRLMPVAGGAPRVIAYLYGGGSQDDGPYWSADSRHISFISNSGMSVK
jgi:TolB protein